MKNPRTRFLLASLLVTSLLLGGSLVASASRRSIPAPDSLYKYLTVFTEVLGLVQQAYVHETEVDTLMGGAYEGTADALDVFAVYVPANRADAFRAHLAAPPVDSGLFLVREKGWVYVATVVPHSPADEAGVEAGDLLARVGGDSTREMDVWEIEERLRGATTAPVDLEVLRRGERHELPLRLAAYSAPVVSRQVVREVPVLRVARFDSTTAAAVREELARADIGDKLVIDLRSIAGGDAEVAYAVADLLVDGELGSLQRRGQVVRRFGDQQKAVWHGHLAVLVDHGTVGAAEVLARVLEQGASASLVGEPTFGHAGRSAVLPVVHRRVAPADRCLLCGAGRGAHRSVPGARLRGARAAAQAEREGPLLRGPDPAARRRAPARRVAARDRPRSRLGALLVSRAHLSRTASGRA